MIYLDTSVLGALFFREPAGLAILAHLETVDTSDLCILICRSESVRSLLANQWPVPANSCRSGSIRERLVSAA